MLNCSAWARDALYVTVGHAASAVSARLPQSRGVGGPPAKRQRRNVVPGNKIDSDVFKQAANDAAWAARKRLVGKYLNLREVNPGSADRFLSKLFKTD